MKGVIWLLNESDVSDERLFYAEGLSFNEQGLPNRFPWLGASGFWGKLLTGISRWNQGRSQLLNVMVRLETFRTYSRRLGASTQPPDILCRAIKTFSEKLREKKIPLLIVFTPHPDRGISANWPGYRYQREELLSMVACAKASGFPVLDLTNDPIKADWYAADEIHFSPAGSKWLADRIAPSVKKWMETP